MASPLLSSLVLRAPVNSPVLRLWSIKSELDHRSVASLTPPNPPKPPVPPDPPPAARLNPNPIGSKSIQQHLLLISSVLSLYLQQTLVSPRSLYKRTTTNNPYRFYSYSEPFFHLATPLATINIFSVLRIYNSEPASHARDGSEKAMEGLTIDVTLVGDSNPADNALSDANSFTANSYTHSYTGHGLLDLKFWLLGLYSTTYSALVIASTTPLSVLKQSSLQSSTDRAQTLGSYPYYAHGYYL